MLILCIADYTHVATQSYILNLNTQYPYVYRLYFCICITVWLFKQLLENTILASYAKYE